MEVSNKDKDFNPLIVNLQVLKVGYNNGKKEIEPTVGMYYNQIKNNLYVAQKAEYLVARDVHDAYKKLSSDDFRELTVDMLGFAESTTSKYKTVGADTRLWNLFGKGKLPMKWTSLYLMTTLTDIQFKKVEANMDCDITATQIKQLADVSKKQSNEFKEMMLSFLEVQIDNTVGVVGFKSLLTKVQSALKKIPEINIKEDKVETVLGKLTSYETKKKKQDQEIMKARKVLSDAGTSFEQAKQAVA